MSEAKRTPTEKHDIARRALPMPLVGAAISDNAAALVSALLDEAIVPRPTRPTSVAKHKAAIGALLCDLIRAEAKGKWGKRSLGTSSFVGGRFGVDIFRPVYRGLRDARYVEFERGHRQTETYDNGLPPYVWGRLSCFRLTERFWQTADAFGIALDRWKDHFTPIVPEAVPDFPLLELKAEKKDAEGNPVMGDRQLPIDPNDTQAEAIRRGIEETNTFLHRAGIEGIAFAGLKRMFTVSWARHGRYYSLGGGDAYERMSPQDRLETITIGGEKVAEVDISATHLSILYGLQAVSFDPEIDPYAVDGINDRDVVKAWVTRSLGAGHADHRGWSGKIGVEYHKRTGRKPLGRDYPIASVRQAVLKRHPILSGLRSYQVDSLDLQYVEAEILTAAMCYLRGKNVASLPMHDGLIVPMSAIEETKIALRGSFAGYFRQALENGVRIIPRLKVDPR